MEYHGLELGVGFVSKEPTKAKVPSTGLVPCTTAALHPRLVHPVLATLPAVVVQEGEQALESRVRSQIE